MGCVWGKQTLEHQNFALLAAQTCCFSETDIEALYVLFKKLSSSLVDDGLISKDELQLGLFKSRKKQSLFADRVSYDHKFNTSHSRPLILSFPTCCNIPLLSQIFKLFDYKQDGVIEFQEFVRSLSVFHPAAPQEEKAIFAFKLYDTWETGFIERDEVRELISALLEESDLVFPSDIIETIINKVLLLLAMVATRT
ncbi:hypothetical protein CDL15_Pgr018034 [Punica granatum]|uniref:Calcineurin B-like protein n=1 Tax=Punica granatum TaxID=22663 RepID=A0A218WIT6_PUNGR|nr:hypothetical protein CDL15_Pgr018034 [Punica granatum]